MPDILELGEVILEREFESTKADGSITTIVVKIAKPIFDPTIDWECRFQFVGIGDEKIRHTYGIDSVQALLESLKIVEVYVLYWERVAETTITWLGSDDLGLIRSKKTLGDYKP